MLVKVFPQRVQNKTVYPTILLKKKKVDIFLTWAIIVKIVLNYQI